MSRLGKLIHLFTYLISIALVISPIRGVAVTAAPASFTVSADKDVVTVGDEVTITIHGVNLTDLYGFEATVRFDSGKLNFVRASSSLQGFSTAPNVVGDTVVWASTKIGSVSGISGNTDIAVMRFRAAAAGSSYIQLSSLKEVTVDAARVVRSSVLQLGSQVEVQISAQGNSGGGGGGILRNSLSKKYEVS